MILHVPVTRIPSAQMPQVPVLVGASGRGAVGIGAADKTKLERIPARSLVEKQPIFEHIADHVSTREFIKGNRRSFGRTHLSEDHTQRRKIVGLVLLEGAEFVGRIQTAAGQAIKAAFTTRLVLSQLHQRLKKTSVLGLLHRGRIGKHPPPRKVWVVGDREYIAARISIDTLCSQLTPELGHISAPGIVGTDGVLSHSLVPEDDVAVKISKIRSIAVLVGNEGRKFAIRAAIVVIFRRSLDIPPKLQKALWTVRAR